MTKQIITDGGDLLVYLESNQPKAKDSKAEGSVQDLQKEHYTTVTEGKDSKLIHKKSSVPNCAFLIPRVPSSHPVLLEISPSYQSTGLDLVLSTSHRWRKNTFLRNLFTYNGYEPVHDIILFRIFRSTLPPALHQVERTISFLALV